ncbi:Hypothetical protein ERS031474_01823 [Mycobacterium tuberculosis]|nr:Hypothetical protein ERS031474_01823 [Mycobacterium tuberculosis]
MDDELRGLLARYARGELSADDARRAILRYPKWRVAEIDGELETVALDDGTPMLIAESSASDGREYSGLELVRDIAPLVGGLSFDPDEPWGSAFRPGALPELQNWARTVELEDAVAKPGPGQRDLLYEGPWWVAVSPGTGRPAVHRADGLDVITIMTAPDAAATFRRTERHRGLDVVRLGPALWGDLAKRSDFDGVRLNPLRPLAQLWPPHVPAMLVAGCDPRPNAEPLPARTVAEIHLWLEQMGRVKKSANCPTVRPRSARSPSRAPGGTTTAGRSRSPASLRRPTPKVWARFRPGSSAPANSAKASRANSPACPG